eukprot:2560269-Ditylum_brightwellii.AAC.2
MAFRASATSWVRRQLSLEEMADAFDLTYYVKLLSRGQSGLIGKAAPAKVLSTILRGIRQDCL